MAIFRSKPGTRAKVNGSIITFANGYYTTFDTVEIALLEAFGYDRVERIPPAPEKPPVIPAATAPAAPEVKRGRPRKPELPLRADPEQLKEIDRLFGGE